MARSYVRGSSGELEAIRETNKDGSQSSLYKADNSVVGALLFGGKGECIEVADHNKDGTTQAYEADTSVLGSLLFGGKGKEK
jgi:hypothetical protein